MKGIKMNKNRLGFTMAEVLITLGVIGVVAAMTMTTLIQSYQKHTTVNRLKKVQSVLNQAIAMSVLENGNTWEWDYGDGTLEATDIFLKKYIFPYMKIIKICGLSNSSDCFSDYVYALDGITVQNTIINKKWFTFVISDGTAIATKMETKNSKPFQLTLRVDINGKRKPNRSGRDLFCYNMRISDVPTTEMLYLNVIPCFQGYNRNVLTKSNGYCASDKTSHGYGCSALIEQDGWKISKDYPW